VEPFAASVVPHPELKAGNAQVVVLGAAVVVVVLESVEVGDVSVLESLEVGDAVVPESVEDEDVTVLESLEVGGAAVVVLESVEGGDVFVLESVELGVGVVPGSVEVEVVVEVLLSVLDKLVLETGDETTEDDEFDTVPGLHGYLRRSLREFNDDCDNFFSGDTKGAADADARQEQAELMAAESWQLPRYVGMADGLDVVYSIQKVRASQMKRTSRKSWRQLSS